MGELVATPEVASNGQAASLRSLLEAAEGLDAESQRALLAVVRQVVASHPAGGRALDERHVIQRALLATAGSPGDTYEEILARPAPPVLLELPEAQRLALPRKAPELEHAFSDVLRARASRRDFSGAPLRLTELGALLHHSYGVRGATRAYSTRAFPLRTAPSAGGLQSANLYVIALSVEDVEAGAYGYLPATHELGLLDAGALRRPIVACCLGQEWVASAAAVLVLTFDVTRGEWKYGSRVLRFGFMDVGVLVENVYLVATALGLRTCAIAGFREDLVADLLRLDGRDEVVALLMPVGTQPPKTTKEKADG
jgi:SagB-type dehydrogenase family enzyme